MYKVVKNIIIALILLLIYIIGVAVGIMYEKANEKKKIIVIQVQCA